jgi:hypothetical protein
MLLVEPGQEIGVTIPGTSLMDGAEITGSPGSSRTYYMEQRIFMTRYRLDSIRVAYENASAARDVNAMTRLAEQYDSVFTSQRKFTINQIITEPSALSNLMLLYQKVDEETYVLYKDTDLQYMKIVKDSLLARYPTSKYVVSLQADFEYQMGNFRNLQFQSLLEQMEDTDLDIYLPGPDGDSIRMSSLRGDYVLLGFWASWNDESVENNREILDFYNRYHPRGFQVYQVSLDTSLTEWKQLIAFDGIPWTQVSELSYPDSRIDRVFNVQSLPANYLLDPEGRIIAKNLFGTQLRIKLSQIYD